MAPVTVDPDKVLGFADQQSFEAWLAKNHDKTDELWLRIYKKGSDTPTVSYAQALDVALCWGWVDSIKKTFDEASFLQRFGPRKKKSVWSQINCGHIERLTAAGRMQKSGLAHVEAAKADGRWDAAYAAPSKMEVPAALLAAIEAEPRAYETFQTLNKQNLFALAFRIGNLKTEAARVKNIEKFVAMLARGETLYPNGKGKAK